MKTFRRSLHPFAAASASALATVAQPVAAGASSSREGVVSVRAGDSPVRLGTASPGVDAFARTDTDVPAAKAMVNPSAGRSPGGSTASPGNPTDPPGNSSGSSGGSVSSPRSPASPSGGSVGAPGGNVPKGLGKFYEQKVNWAPCKNKLQVQCVNMEVPLDYKKLGGGAIAVAMAKPPAKGGEPIGSLFTNPDGPGGSGITILLYVNRVLSKDIMNEYDIAGFDPREVSSSTPVNCFGDRETAKAFDSDYNVSTVAGHKAQKVQAEKVTEGYKRRSGGLLTHVGTESAAHDMNVLRGLVGDEKLNYLGFSYGTSLGGIYADLFLEKVSRTMLNSAVDTGIWDSHRTYEQELGFEHAFERYTQHCVDTGSCPLGSPMDAVKKEMRTLLDQAFKKLFPTSSPNRKLARSLLTDKVKQYLYVDASWPDLNEKLRKLVKEGGGSAFEGSGSDSVPTISSNRTETFITISCADYVLDPWSEYAKYNERSRREAPVFGRGGVETKDRYIYAELPHHPESNPGPYGAKGSAPVVVIGMRHDPAALCSWIWTFTGALDNSVLLTWGGDGHTTYGRAESCIQGPVDKYLLTDEVPKDDLVCLVGRKWGQNAR